MGRKQISRLMRKSGKPCDLQSDSMCMIVITNRIRIVVAIWAIAHHSTRRPLTLLVAQRDLMTNDGNCGFV